jgi:hypothetical protein
MYNEYSNINRNQIVQRSVKKRQYHGDYDDNADRKRVDTGLRLGLLSVVMMIIIMIIMNIVMVMDDNDDDDNYDY